ncbi:DUF2147 domain-containing protein [Rhizobium jaguaris]|uniref:DUF2147 domain-containing protein n=1 Tax=Rhizobium jaguaris TaxID=1312183 RepID=A0A387FVH1_9HYPH|nr:DUF2147 domain-containing protein [Rhizobium jaguaris]AYG58926.1 DUF2147 domain-containing protein [Rhizobium jaguaris]
MKHASILAAILVLMAGAAEAADPLIGNWKTEDGATASIAHCGAGYCITMKTGKYVGRKIGNFSGKDGSYAGQITDPKTNKTYNGTLKISGISVKMQGCVMKVFCQSQTWTRL